MNEHIEGIVKVGFVNLAAISVSFAQVEAAIRVSALFLGLIYTCIQIVKALRR